MIFENLEFAIWWNLGSLTPKISKFRILNPNTKCFGIWTQFEFSCNFSILIDGVCWRYKFARKFYRNWQKLTDRPQNCMNYHSAEHQWSLIQLITHDAIWHNANQSTNNQNFSTDLAIIIIRIVLSHLWNFASIPLMSDILPWINCPNNGRQ